MDELEGSIVSKHLRATPFGDELISSWFLRLCKRAGLTPHEFRLQYFGAREIWNVDIDRCFGPEEVLQVARTLDVDVGDYILQLLRCGSLPSDEIQRTRVMLVVGLNHRDRTRHGLQYCPACLREGREPYFRRAWRNALNVACPAHSVALVDSCHGCDAPLASHRVEGCRITQCSNCETCLLDAPRYSLDARSQKYQRAQAESEFRASFVHDWGGFAHLFWCLSARSSHADRFASAIQSRGYSAWVPPVLSAPLVFQPVVERIRLLPMIWQIYQAGSEFIADLLREAIGNSLLLEEFLGRPGSDDIARKFINLVPGPERRAYQRRSSAEPRERLVLQRDTIGLTEIYRARGRLY